MLPNAMQRMWGWGSSRGLPGSPGPQASPYRSPRNGSQGYRASASRMSTFYKYLAAFLIANILLKGAMMMTAARFPGLLRHMPAWFAPVRPRKWTDDFPLPQLNSYCIEPPPDDYPVEGPLQDSAGGPSGTQGDVSVEELRLVAAQQQQLPGREYIGTAAPEPWDPAWSSQLMQVLGMLTEASAQRDVWGNSTLVAKMTDRVSSWLAGRTCSQQICNHLLQLPKVALLFLSKGALHHEALWSRWFELLRAKLPIGNLHEAVCSHSGAQTSQLLLQVVQQVCAAAPGDDVIAQQFLFSVYVHVPPDVTDIPRDSLFYKYLLPVRTKTRWGSFELVLAAKLLLRQALLEPANSHFVMVSESDIPLYPPTTTYLQLLSESRSRIDACGQEDTSQYRWRRVMGRAGVPRNHWRKSWQWFMLLRDHAQLVVDDNHVHWAFERYCNPTVHETSREGGFDCYSDEHYIPTLLSISGKENETSCQRTITNVDWRTGGPHPRTYRQRDISSIRAGNAALVNVTALSPQTPGVTSLCSDGYPSYDTPLGDNCPLFARKFVNETATDIFKLYTDCSKKMYVVTQDGEC